MSVLSFSCCVVIGQPDGDDIRKIEYDTLCLSDKQEIRKWIDDRLEEMTDELDDNRSRSWPGEFRCMVDHIEIANNIIIFHMDASSTPGGTHCSSLQEGFNAEISDGYLNDCSSDDIDLSNGNFRIYFDYI